jgi:hypothetical protein
MLQKYADSLKAADPLTTIILGLCSTIYDDHIFSIAGRILIPVVKIISS